jgi:hypothetical protein
MHSQYPTSKLQHNTERCTAIKRSGRRRRRDKTRNIQPLPSQAPASTACKAATIQCRQHGATPPRSLGHWHCSPVEMDDLVPPSLYQASNDPSAKWLGIGETRAMTEFGRREGRWLRSSFNLFFLFWHKWRQASLRKGNRNRMCL